MKKRFLPVLLVLSLALGLSAPSLAAGQMFSDVPASYWGYTDIEAVAEAGLMKGAGSGLFSPEMKVSVAQFLNLLGRLVFPDVKTEGNDWFGPYVAATQKAGLLIGSQVDTGNIEAEISRYDMAVILRAAAKKLGVAEKVAQSSEVADFGMIPNTYTEAVLAVYGIGLIKGDQTGNFNGANTMTRAEVATVIMRLANAKPDVSNSSVTEEVFVSPGHNLLGYLLYRPAEAAPGMPLVVYLHGGSGKGDDLSLLTAQEGFPQYLVNGMLGEVPAYVVIPQLSAQKRGWAEAAEDVFALVEYIGKEYEIDLNKVGLTGHSMGGTGAWGLAVKKPELFSCVVPMSGSVKMTQGNVDALADMPVWAFVGENDTIVSPDSSQRFVEALMRTGGNAQITVMPQTDHFTVSTAYLNDAYAILEWILAQ